MNRKGVAVAALLGTLGLPLYGQASDYAEISRQAEQQARWGSLGAAISAYRQVLANADLQASHNQARLRLARLYLDSFDYPAARLVALDPGWVQTDMGGAAAPLTPEHSASSLRQTLSQVLEQRDPKHRGAFLNHDGQPLPW